jgi:hypothetical protein
VDIKRSAFSKDLTKTMEYFVEFDGKREIGKEVGLTASLFSEHAR